MRLLIAGLIGLLINAPAIAIDIQYVDSNIDGNHLYVDADSVIPIQGGFEFNSLMIAKNDNRKIVSRNQILCNARASRAIAYQSYTLDGQLINQRSVPKNQFHNIKLGSLESSLWERLCE